MLGPSLSRKGAGQREITEESKTINSNSERVKSKIDFSVCAITFDCNNKMSSSTALDNGRQSRRDAASRELDLLIRDLADAR